MKHIINVTIDAENLERFDRVRGLIPRSAVIDRLIRQYSQDPSILSLEGTIRR